MNIDTNEFLWAQKFRPKTVDDCILPAKTKKQIKDMISKGEITHLLFTGGPGMGKTTLAYCIANELGSDVMYVNAALEASIDLMRTKVMSFASTVSLSDSGPKIIIMDEADGIRFDAQNGLKAFLEQFSSNCRFIFTANLRHKLIEPIQSRCTHVDFRIESEDKKTLMALFYKRILSILDNEGVKYDQKAVAKLIDRNFPDFRRTLNELQRYGESGEIDTGILINRSTDDIARLVSFVKEKNFKEIRKWIGENEDIEASTLFRQLYNLSETNMKKASIPQLIHILAEYQYKAAFVVDQQINTAACMLEIMANCEWE